MKKVKFILVLLILGVLTGCVRFNGELNIKKDISILLKMDKEEIEKMGKYNREIVKKYYSLDKMVNDAISIYRKENSWKKARKRDGSLFWFLAWKKAKNLLTKTDLGGKIN